MSSSSFVCIDTFLSLSGEATQHSPVVLIQSDKQAKNHARRKYLTISRFVTLLNVLLNIR